MSLKAIDMQFAVQKSSETGNRQNQLLHKPQADQSLLAAAAERNTELARQISSKVDQTSNHQIRDGQQNGKNKLLKTDKKKQDKADLTATPQLGASIEHPYKGKHIDLSL
jgi:hypothetical protein